METIKDFLTDLKDRLTNPIISSYIIGWLVANWRITIGILIYKQEDLKLDGYHSYIDLIVKESNWINALVIPLAVSMFYTFGFPWIKAFVKLKHAQITSKNDTDILYATKDSRIPVTKYIKLKDGLTQVTDRLNELFESEGTFEEMNNNLKLEAVNKDITIKELENTIFKEKDNLTKYHALRDPNLLSGSWEVKTTYHNGTVAITHWQVMQNYIEVDGTHKYNLISYIMDPFASRAVFQIIDVTEENTSYQKIITYIVSYDSIKNEFSTIPPNGTHVVINTFREVLMTKTSGNPNP